MAQKKVRLIARLDVKGENLVKGIQLEGLRKLGDPNAFARRYYEQGIDELLYIDIVASLYNRNNLADIVRRTVNEVYIPVCVGGGLRSVEDVRQILSMGADKVAINTAAIKRPELITEVAEAFGSQCMVLSIQAKRSRTQPGKWEAYYDNGRAHSGYDVVEWAKRGEALGAGEILLMSVDNEGLQRGMDLELIEAVTAAVKIPVICGGGAGCGEDLADAARAGADAVACAAVLHYGKETVPELKEDLQAAGAAVRCGGTDLGGVAPDGTGTAPVAGGTAQSTDSAARAAAQGAPAAAPAPVPAGTAAKADPFSPAAQPPLTVTVVDYGLSNLLSVRHALEHLGAQVELTSDPAVVLAARALVLPGVGAFRDGMDGLRRLGLIEPLRQKAAAGTPLLGICLGMQMLFDRSEEFGLHDGLGLIPGRVIRIPDAAADGTLQRVPHICWAPLRPAGAEAPYPDSQPAPAALPGLAGAPVDFAGTALQGVAPGQECYFIHSYEAVPLSPADRLADTVYGGRRICAAARHGSVLGCQFHPEKSGPVGLRILEEFLRLCQGSGSAGPSA